MSNFVKRLIVRCKVRTFFKLEIILVCILILSSNLIYNHLVNEIQSDTTRYQNEILETHRDIIEMESEMFRFVMSERGSIINDSVSYDDYVKIIDGYKNIFDGNEYIDSLMGRKIEIKKEYLNSKLKRTPVNKIKVSFSKKFIIGDPNKHFEVDSRQYENNVLSNVNSMISNRHNLIKENTEIDKVILSYINIKINISSAKGTRSTKELNDKVNDDISKISKLSVIHTISVLILMLAMLIDLRKIFRRSKRRDNVIDTIIQEKINK